VWIVLQIHFVNPKTSLYCSETRFGTAFQRENAETIDNKGFQQIPMLKHATHQKIKSAESLVGKGF
jgi:predicted HAD superfamily hydrolase